MTKIFLSSLALMALISCNQTRVTDSEIYIASQLYSEPVSPTKITTQLTPVRCITECLKVSEQPDSTNFYTMFKSDIRGFTFEPNFKYKLRIRFTSNSNSLAFDRQLLETLEKTPAQ